MSDYGWVCTQKGRVVYNRRPSLFSFRDIHRILKKIPRPAWYEYEERYWLLRALASLALKNSFVNIFRILPWAPERSTFISDMSSYLEKNVRDVIDIKNELGEYGSF